MKEIRNIKYTYYDRRNGSGPYQGSHQGYCVSQSSYTSVEDMHLKTHPDFDKYFTIRYRFY